MVLLVMIVGMSMLYGQMCLVLGLLMAFAMAARVYGVGAGSGALLDWAVVCMRRKSLMRQ